MEPTLSLLARLQHRIGPAISWAGPGSGARWKKYTLEKVHKHALVQEHSTPQVLAAIPSPALMLSSHVLPESLPSPGPMVAG
ncbi:hypothetical protein LIPSTDRAFT_70219 [Lipomyces starkeyi NRRL Y-11557]|uniref:Uncharacterized protein n=1 Tax=Lipomyces starkeyi NRRL Y-11557 TaxID=675824 RepID=A0A1E3QA59_LIPST|nr:hypothetical protein LIPSTDRAFT_70219 [Lipomyces starkeyi NRRL Y-11557]